MLLAEFGHLLFILHTQFPVCTENYKYFFFFLNLVSLIAHVHFFILSFRLPLDVLKEREKWEKHTQVTNAPSKTSFFRRKQTKQKIDSPHSQVQYGARVCVR